MRIDDASEDIVPPSDDHSRLLLFDKILPSRAHLQIPVHLERVP